jgi:hypothetical protein
MDVRTGSTAGTCRPDDRLPAPRGSWLAAVLLVIVALAGPFAVRVTAANPNATPPGRQSAVEPARPSMPPGPAEGPDRPDTSPKAGKVVPAQSPSVADPAAPDPSAVPTRVEPAATPTAVPVGNPATPSPTARSGGGGTSGTLDGGAGRASPGAAAGADDRDGTGARPSAAPATPDTSPAASVGPLAGGRNPPPHFALAAATLIAAGAIVVMAATKRVLRAAAVPPGGERTPAASILEGPDLDLLVTAALTGGPRQTDGRGSQVLDRAALDAGEGAPDVDAPDPAVSHATTPAWVRRLHHRIPVLPTIGTLPVDNDARDHRSTRDARRRR